MFHISLYYTMHILVCVNTLCRFWVGLLSVMSRYTNKDYYLSPTCWETSDRHATLSFLQGNQKAAKWSNGSKYLKSKKH